MKKKKRLVAFAVASGCCGTADAVEQRALDDTGAQYAAGVLATLATKKKRLDAFAVASECCGTADVVEHRMLWNSGCCGTADVVEKRML